MQLLNIFTTPTRAVSTTALPPEPARTTILLAPTTTSPTAMVAPTMTTFNKKRAG